MGITFDPASKYIKITSPTTTLTALEIYNATMDWCDDQQTIGYTVPMRAVGKAPLGGGVYTDSIFILQDGWKIKFWSGTYQAIIMGTLITDDETPRTVPPDSGNVEVVFQVSSQGTVIPDVAEWTQIEKDGIITDVDTIQAKTDNLPADPATQSLVQAVKTKTDLLPTDPASEGSIQTVDEDLIRHDVEIKGKSLHNVSWQMHEASLIEVRKTLEELKTKQVKAPPKSIAAVLEKKLNP